MRTLTRILLVCVAALAATAHAQLRHDPDINDDGTVNFVDLGLLRACFFMPPDPPCETRDFNGDGAINVQDLGALRAAFFQSFPTPAEAASLYPKILRSPFAANAQALDFTDLNRDGLPDVVAASMEAQQLVWALGNGDGTFGDSASIGYTDPSFLTLGNFNADNDPDLVVVDAVANRLDVFLGDGAGGFVASLSSLSPAATINGVAFTDLNADGRDDVVLTFLQPASVATYLVQQDGSFALQQEMSLPFPVSQPVVSDLDLDGAPDLLLLVRESGDERIEVLPGVAKSQFGDAQRLALNYDVVVVGFSVENVNDDAWPDVTFWGNNDMFISRFYVSTTVLNLGAGDFTYTAPSAIDGGRPVFYGDIDGDGDVDALTGGMRARYQTGDGVFGLLEQYSFGGGATQAQVVDFNVDGVPDVGAYEPGQNQVTVILGRANAPIITSSDVGQRPVPISDFGSPLTKTTDAYLGDWNGDGSIDVLLRGDQTMNSFGEYFETFNDFAQGAWSPTSTLSTFDYWPRVWVADANGDGYRDVLFTADFPTTIYGASGNGNGSLTPFQDFTIIPQNTGGTLIDRYDDLQFVDVNDDTLTDAVATTIYYGPTSVTSTLVEMLRQPDGQYVTGRVAALPFTGRILRATDIDSDGEVDFVVAHGTSVSAVINVDDGTLDVLPLISTGLPGIGFLETADFNRDGYADVVAVSRSGAAAMMLGTPTANLEAAFALTSEPGSISSIDIADLNADGRPDLIFAYQDRDAVAILLGNGDGSFQPPLELVVGSAPGRVFAVDLEGDGLMEIVTYNTGRQDFSVLRRVYE